MIIRNGELWSMRGERASHPLEHERLGTFDVELHEVDTIEPELRDEVVDAPAFERNLAQAKFIQSADAMTRRTPGSTDADARR